MNSIELREQRAKMIYDARQLVNKADAEKRSMLAEEKEQWDKFEKDAETLSEKIETLERREKTERYERELNSATKPTTPQRASKPTGNVDKAFQDWAVGQRKRRYSQDDYANAENCGISLTNPSMSVNWNSPITNKRNQRSSSTVFSVGNSGYGSDLATYNFGQSFQEAMLFTGNILNDVTIRNTPNGLSYNEILVDDTGNNAAIVSENADQSSSFTDPTTASVALASFLYRTQIQVSRNLIQDSVIPVIPMLMESFGKRIGRKWNSDAMIGAGSTLPYGIVARSTSASITVAGTNASPQLSWDNLADLVAALDPAYSSEAGAGFYMHTKTRWAAAKIKDDSGRYILNLSTVPSEPDTVWGYPLNVNNAMAQMSTANAKAIIFASPKHYVWRIVSNVEIIKTEDLYLPTNEVGFFLFARADGNLVNTAASYYLQAPAS